MSFSAMGLKWLNTLKFYDGLSLNVIRVCSFAEPRAVKSIMLSAVSRKI